MKNLIVFATLFLFSFNLKSQVEFSFNPIALLFEAGVFSVEYSPNPDWGFGADAAVASQLGMFYGNAKHYFNPKRGGDRFNIGTFVGTAGDFDENGFGVGFFTGYKWISRKNITLELAAGLVRDFTKNIEVLPYLKFNVGYRFKKRTDK